MDNVNNTLGNRRDNRDHDQRLTEASQAAIGITRPMLQFQTSVIRLFADQFEVWARSYETMAQIAGQQLQGGAQDQTRQQG
jgi:hypothetical protein